MRQATINDLRRIATITHVARRAIQKSLVEARRNAGRTNLRARRFLADSMVRREVRRRADVEERAGITVVTVTWNSLEFLRGMLEGVREFSDDHVEILVVDNHSSDGTAEYLAERPDVRVITTPINIGHGLGLDLAFAHATTTDVVALDVDAFPISHDWLAAVLDPLDNGAIVAGAYVQRAFLHPSFIGMRRRDFYRLRLSFAPVGVRTAPGERPRGLFMDVGEALSQTVAVAEGSDALHRIPITSTRGPNLIGSVYGDRVYHNFYSTQGEAELVELALQAWEDARANYLPPQARKLSGG